ITSGVEGSTVPLGSRRIAPRSRAPVERRCRAEVPEDDRANACAQRSRQAFGRTCAHVVGYGDATRRGVEPEWEEGALGAGRPDPPDAVAAVVAGLVDDARAFVGKCGRGIEALPRRSRAARLRHDQEARTAVVLRLAARQRVAVALDGEAALGVAVSDVVEEATRAAADLVGGEVEAPTAVADSSVSRERDPDDI